MVFRNVAICFALEWTTFSENESNCAKQTENCAKLIENCAEK